MRISGQTKTTPTAHQNVSGTSDTVGFFPYAWPEYDMIKPGWSVVQIPGTTVVSVDGTYHVITISGGNFTSGSSYTFTGKTGLKITGGLTIGSTPAGEPPTYTYMYFSTQSWTNDGSNAIHLEGESWSASVPIGAKIDVQGDPREYTVDAVIFPGDPGNTSGNWFYAVTPTDGIFSGGTNLTFKWN